MSSKTISRIKVQFLGEPISKIFPQNDITTEIVSMKVTGTPEPYKKFADPSNFGEGKYTREDSRPLMDVMYNIPIYKDDLQFDYNGTPYLVFVLKIKNPDIYNHEEDDKRWYLQSIYTGIYPSILLNFNDSTEAIGSITNLEDTFDEIGDDENDLNMV